MASYTYLTNDIIQACDNTGAEFSQNIPRMVNRAELKLVKDLDDYGLVKFETGNFSVGNNLFTLPSGTIIIKNIHYTNTAGSKINLLMRTDEYINDYWPVSSSVGEPRYYAQRNGTTVLLAPTPSAGYASHVVFVARPSALGPTNVSAATSALSGTLIENNYFSEFCYDVLFNACMIEAMLFQKDFPAVQFYEQRYAQILQLHLNQVRRTRRDDMEAPASPAGADNPLIPNSN